MKNEMEKWLANLQALKENNLEKYQHCQHLFVFKDNHYTCIKCGLSDKISRTYKRKLTSYEKKMLLIFMDSNKDNTVILNDNESIDDFDEIYYQVTNHCKINDSEATEEVLKILRK